MISKHNLLKGCIWFSINKFLSIRHSLLPFWWKLSHLSHPSTFTSIMFSQPWQFLITVFWFDCMRSKNTTMDKKYIDSQLQTQYDVNKVKSAISGTCGTKWLPDIAMLKALRTVILDAYLSVPCAIGKPKYIICHLLSCPVFMLHFLVPFRHYLCNMVYISYLKKKKTLRHH